MKLRQSSVSFLASLSLLAAFSLSSGAQAGTVPAEKRYAAYSGNIATCEDSGILGTIQSHFAQKESEFWHSSLTIASFDRVHQYALRADGKSYIPRRYCTARALLSDNKYRQVTYWVGERLGMIGLGSGVEFCVAGLDRNFAYAPGCRAVRP